MASIYKRNSGKNTKWRAIVCVRGFPTIEKSLDRNQEAEDWANDTERKIKSGQLKFDQYKINPKYSEGIANQILQGNAQ